METTERRRGGTAKTGSPFPPEVRVSHQALRINRYPGPRAKSAAVFAGFGRGVADLGERGIFKRGERAVAARLEGPLYPRWKASFSKALAHWDVSRSLSAERRERRGPPLYSTAAFKRRDESEITPKRAAAPERPHPRRRARQTERTPFSRAVCHSTPPHGLCDSQHPLKDKCQAFPKLFHCYGCQILILSDTRRFLNILRPHVRALAPVHKRQSPLTPGTELHVKVRKLIIQATTVPRFHSK